METWTRKNPSTEGSESNMCLLRGDEVVLPQHVEDLNMEQLVVRDSEIHGKGVFVKEGRHFEVVNGETVVGRFHGRLLEWRKALLPYAVTLWCHDGNGCFLKVWVDLKEGPGRINSSCVENECEVNGRHHNNCNGARNLKLTETGALVADSLQNPLPGGTELLFQYCWWHCSVSS